jgi:hypothetical protein
MGREPDGRPVAGWCAPPADRYIAHSLYKLRSPPGGGHSARLKNPGLSPEEAPASPPRGREGRGEKASPGPAIALEP